MITACALPSSPTARLTKLMREFKVPSETIRPFQMSLIRAEGRWYVDGTDLARALLTAAVVDPKTTAMMQNAGRVSSDLARRVRAGEFASVQEAMMAMGEAMMPQMSGSGR